MPLVPQDQFQFCGPTYLAVSPVLDAQRSINLYPDPGIASSKSRMGLTGRPGFRLFSAGHGTVGHSLWAGNGRLFAALGGHVYELDNFGGDVTDYGPGLNVGTPSPAPMIANGTQLLICDPVLHRIFNVNPGGPSLDLVLNGNALEFLDGFYVAIASGASLAGVNPNQINASANGDGTTWPALSYAIRTGAADLTIQLAVLNGLLYIFGQKTIEVWYNAGNAIFPLARVNGGQINLGCLASASVVKFSNTILWLGSDQTGYGQVYMMQGMNPLRVSTPAIEGIIANASPFAKAFGYQEAGRAFYQLDLCNTSYQASQTVVYDLTTGLWHERAYVNGTGIYPTGFASVPNFGAAIPNFVVDGQSGKVYYQSIIYANDGGAGKPITYTRTAPHSSNQNQWIRYPRFELSMDPQATGAAGTIAPILDYSNNGGKSFLGRNYAMARAYDQGTEGGFQRFYALQLGRSRDRVFKVTIVDDTNLIRIVNGYLTAELG